MAEPTSGPAFGDAGGEHLVTVAPIDDDDDSRRTVGLGYETVQRVLEIGRPPGPGYARSRGQGPAEHQECGEAHQCDAARCIMTIHPKDDNPATLGRGPTAVGSASVVYRAPPDAVW